jgi:hypothetical protein
MADPCAGQASRIRGWWTDPTPTAGHYQAISRTHELMRRYADLPLGFADAAVIACAERHRGRVLTLDLRDCGMVAREGRITLALAPGA